MFSDLWPYLVAAVIAIAGLFGWRNAHTRQQVKAVKAEDALRRAQHDAAAAKEKNDLESEVEALDPDTLRDRAAVWVRGNNADR